VKFHIGTSGYGYKEWKGKFYPEKIPPSDMLRFYAEHLGAVEINNTFYHMPTESVLNSWAQQVPDNFVFAVKAPQIITHRKRLKNVEPETEYLFRTLPVLNRKQGPVLFQFPGHFHADLKRLEDFLALIPARTPSAFEFRSPSWQNDETRALLGGKSCALCISDTEETPAGAVLGAATWGYLRLRRSDYTEDDLARWLDNILVQKWETVFVFFKHEDKAKGPELAMHFRKLAKA
jgi:uncharacterized protein YecE (DUF72 family)